MSSGRAFSPCVPHQCTSASSCPCVTQISRRAGGGDGVAQAVPVGVIGNHQRQFGTRLCRARARTRIQPEA